MASVSDRLYSSLVEDEESHGCRELPGSACREVPGNAAKLVSGFMLQTLGDRIADPKTVLSWILTSLGAPAFTIAMLDLGRGDERTRYVAVANTVIGVALLTIGGAGAVIFQLVGSVWLLTALAIAGVMGTFASVRMTEIQGMSQASS